MSEKINLAIGEMLASDPANQRYLQDLNGLKVKVDCTQPSTTFLIACQDGEISLSQVTDIEPNIETDLQLTGTAFSLLKLATSPIENASALRGANVSVSGDVGLLLELSQVVKMIDIDWECLLAEKIGETPAVVLSRTLSSGLREARKIREHLSLKLAEKMKSDNSPLPNKTDLSAMKKQLRDLNYRLDRLEATTAEKQS